MFLNTPPWSSDRDHQRRFPRLQTFRPFESPDVFGGRAASGDQPDVPVGFFLSFGTQRLPPAMRGSLWPSYAGHCCLDWSDFRKLSMASSCRILPAFDLQSLTMRGSLWPFYVDRIHSSCLQRSWKVSVAFSHRVLNICKLDLIIYLHRAAGDRNFLNSTAVHIALRARGRSISPDNTLRLSANDLATSFDESFTPEIDGFLRLS